MRLSIERPLPPIDLARLKPGMRSRERLVVVRRCQVCTRPTTGVRCPDHVGTVDRVEAA